VNVSLRCENLQVNGFTDTFLPAARALYEEEEELKLEFTTESQVNQHAAEIQVMDLNHSLASTKAICYEFFGEQPVSFRSLLKRFVTVHAPPAATGSAAAPNIRTVQAPIYPMSTLAYGTTTQTYSDLFTYLRYAYLGIRGGMRYRFFNNVSTLARISVGLDAPSVGHLNTNTISGGVARSRIMGSYSFLNNTLYLPEIEFPFYSNNLFVFPMSENYMLDIATYPGVMESLWFKNLRYVSGSESTISTGTTSPAMDMGTAEDFDLIRFQGAPYYTGGIVG
jgi:hypothetical protein